MFNKNYSIISFAFICFVIFFVLVESNLQAGVYNDSLQKLKEVKDVLKETQKRVDKRLYKTAFDNLQAFDPENEIPEIVLKKIDIALNFYSSTAKLQLFAFEDIEKSKESISSLRETKEQYVMTPFYIDNILDTLIKKFPENAALHNQLGEYYFMVHNMFHGDWIHDDMYVLEQAYIHFGKAISLKKGKPVSYYVKGYVHLIKEEYEQAIPYLSQAIFLDSNYGSAYYNLAYAQYFMGNLHVALINSEIAMRKHENIYSRSESARMAGLICDQLNDQQRAFELFRHAIALNNDNLEAIAGITENCLKNNRVELLVYTKEFALFNPLDFEILSGLLQLFKEYNRQTDLAVMLKQFVPEMNNDAIAVGNIYYCIADLYSTNNKDEAINAYNLAKESYLKKYPPNHVLVVKIEQEIAILKM